MKILVEVQTEIDPTLTVRIDRTTGEASAEPGDQLFRVGTLGRLGIDLALSIPDATLTAFAIGTGHEAALHHALAAGASEAVNLLNGSPGSEGFLNWLKEQSPDIVIAGPQVSCAAGQLDWGHISGVQTIQIVGEKIQVIRLLGRGDRERLQSTLPCMLRVDPNHLPRYVAQARLRKAKEIPIEGRDLTSVTIFQDGLERGPLQATRARTRTSQIPAPAVAMRASDRLLNLMNQKPEVKKPVLPPQETLETPPETPPETPEVMAESFIRYLVHHKLLAKDLR